MIIIVDLYYVHPCIWLRIVVDRTFVLFVTDF